jgi:hypothetical protein
MSNEKISCETYAANAEFDQPLFILLKWTATDAFATLNVKVRPRGLGPSPSVPPFFLIDFKGQHITF